MERDIGEHEDYSTKWNLKSYKSCLEKRKKYTKLLALPHLPPMQLNGDMIKSQNAKPAKKIG
jgi:hypothetical protein